MLRLCTAVGVLQSMIEIWGEGATWEELFQSVKDYHSHLKQPWRGPEVSFKIVVDGWGKAVKQVQQLELINKLEFLDLKVAAMLIAHTALQSCQDSVRKYALAMQGPIRMQHPDVTFRLIVADPTENNGLPNEVR